MGPSPLVQGVCSHVCGPPHGGSFESHLVSGPGVRDVLTFKSDVKGPAFVASHGHARQGRIHMEDGADGGCRCLSRFRIPRAQVHGTGDARTSQARSPIPTKLIPGFPRHGAGLGSEGFGFIACRNHKAMGLQRRLSARRNRVKTQLDGPAVFGHRKGGSLPRTVGVVGGQHLCVIDKHRGIGVDSL